jgi:hypothetical protein
VTEVEPAVVADLHARRLVVTVEARDDALILLITADELRVEISSEPGPLTMAAGGFEELAREAGELAKLLRARAEVKPEPMFPEFSGERMTS